MTALDERIRELNELALSAQTQEEAYPFLLEVEVLHEIRQASRLMAMGGAHA